MQSRKDWILSSTTFRDLEIARAFVTSKKTNREIGNEHDLCPERVRQILTRQCRRLSLPEMMQEDDLHLERPGDLRLKRTQTLRRLDRLEQELRALPSPDRRQQ